MEKHTPGPWTATPNKSGEGFWIGSDTENACYVPGYTDHPGNIANAHLAAAAPEMLEMLRDVLQRSDCMHPMDFYVDSEAIRAIIAKATAPEVVPA